MTGFRPGPPAIVPDSAPGGLVIHVYGEDGRLILERRLQTRADADDTAAADALAVSRNLLSTEACCIVTFDGDTGDRVTPFGQGRADLYGRWLS